MPELNRVAKHIAENPLVNKGQGSTVILSRNLRFKDSRIASFSHSLDNVTNGMNS